MEEVKKDEKKKNKKSDEIKELQQRNAELEEEVLRCKADLINYRKRKDEETSNMIKFANAEFINKILPVLDNFERAMPKDEKSVSAEFMNYLSGFKLIYNSFREILESNGVKEIEVLNKPFDAKVANCVFTEEHSDIENDIVLEVFTKGYTYCDKILRCASVKVNKNENNNIKENDKNE